MEELIKLLDGKLQYISHEIEGNEFKIYVKSEKNETAWPYCGKTFGKVHSRKKRIVKDLPIQSRKVTLYLENRKYFCKNSECSHITFSERFIFCEPRATKTNRLQAEILRVSLTQSSVAASKYLRRSVADVGKSTICNLLKKGHKK